MENNDVPRRLLCDDYRRSQTKKELMPRLIDSHFFEQLKSVGMDLQLKQPYNFPSQAINMPSSDVVNLVQGSLLWEEQSAKFICHLCDKTFYNVNALQNHKNMSHDIGDSTSEGDINWNSSIKLEQNVNGLCGFKFIPLSNPDNTENCSSGNGIITRVFTKDTSYLIVKIENDDMDNIDVKKSRLDGMARKSLQKPKNPPLDLSGPFTCTFPTPLRSDLQCRQIFFNCCAYSLHYREEHTKRRKAPLRCQVCEKRLDRDFYSSNAFEAQFHVPTEFSCDLCGLKFLEGSKFDEHNRIVHQKMKPHQCSICSKRFTQLGGLQQHIRMHTGIRPFTCTFCPKAFTQKAGLDQHLRTHTKVKPFKCVICSKCFSQSVHLRQHMRTHTNIQPFECSVCGRRFKQSSHLNFHLRSHVNEAGALVAKRYAQMVQYQDPMDFLNLANLQPVQDGETMYYAAKLNASGPSAHHNPFCQSQTIMPDNVLSL